MRISRSWEIDAMNNDCDWCSYDGTSTNTIMMTIKDHEHFWNDLFFLPNQVCFVNVKYDSFVQTKMGNLVLHLENKSFSTLMAATRTLNKQLVQDTQEEQPTVIITTRTFWKYSFLQTWQFPPHFKLAWFSDSCRSDSFFFFTFHWLYFPFNFSSLTHWTAHCCHFKRLLIWWTNPVWVLEQSVQVMH